MGLFNGQSTLASIVNDLVGFIDMLIGVLAPLALVIFFWGLVRYIYKATDSEAHAQARETITWSLVALFILFSIWGILSLLNVAFFGGNLNTGNPGGTSGNLPALY